MVLGGGAVLLDCVLLSTLLYDLDTVAEEDRAEVATEAEPKPLGGTAAVEEDRLVVPTGAEPKVFEVAATGVEEDRVRVSTGTMPGLLELSKDIEEDELGVAKGAAMAPVNAVRN